MNAFGYISIISGFILRQTTIMYSDPSNIEATFLVGINYRFDGVLPVYAYNSIYCLELPLCAR